ncbi:MAG: LPS export ABC transporter permease LptF [Pseudohongiellaceae bacterium]
MVIFRYLSRQILQVMCAVTFILLIVGIISRFLQYLGQAVAGELSSDVLLLLMFYRLPDFLLVILPLAFFLGILLAYGRMYAENEMLILLGAGTSQLRLLYLTLGTSLIVLVITAFISLSLAPWGVRNTEQLKQNQEQLTEIDLIVAGQFQAFSGGERVTYTERIDNSPILGRQLQNVFVALSNQDQEVEQAPPRIVLAEMARPEVNPETGARFMRLENVLQYDGTPGTGNFNVAQFDVHSILLPEPTEFEEILEEETMATAELFASNSPEHQAELQWRLSIVLLIPVITLIAIPMSKIDPRQGRYGKLIPAALIYAAYFLLLQFCRDLVAEGSLSAVIGLWWVHVIFIAIGFVMFCFPNLAYHLSLGRRRLMS